jgi:hypothetical protein
VLSLPFNNKKIWMKLKDLAEVFSGVAVDRKWLSSGPDEYLYLTPDQFHGASAYYVSYKNLRKALGQQGPLQQRMLSYGDYLLYEHRENGIQIKRYDDLNKARTVPSGEFILTDSSYLINYLTFDANKDDVKNQLIRYREAHKSLLDSIREVELSSNILELGATPSSEYNAIHEPLNMSQVAINIIQKPMTIDSVIKRLEQNPSEINLLTEFQRKAGLWSAAVKSRLIESMIVGLPIPAYYFDVVNDECWQVVDGIQRLSAIKEFVIDKTLRLEGLEYLQDLEGKSYEELERRAQRNIHEFEIQTYQIKPGTHSGIKYRIFKSINTSALTLERQEIRHAVNPGVPADYLKELSELHIFRAMLAMGDARKDRMEDREQILRYITFRDQHFIHYSPDMMDYLDKAMTRIYHINSDLRDRYKSEFIAALELLQTVFTGKANVFNKSVFGLPDQDHIHNSAIFELLTVCLAEISESTRHLIRQKPTSFKTQLETLSQNTDFIRAIEPSNAWTKSSVETRFTILTKFLKNWNHEY